MENARISFVVPAHNEALVLKGTIEAIHAAAKEAGVSCEVVVADDASTDGTAEIAKGCGARVISVSFRKIAATRNAGARAATGDWIFFVDADTRVTPQVFKAAMVALEKGAAGGGAWTRLEDGAPLYARLLWALFYVVGKATGWTGGAFMFCTRRAFEMSGGFNENLYAGEEGFFAFDLKRAGRFVVLWPRTPTSARRFDEVSGLYFLWTLVRLAFFPTGAKKKDSAVQKVWYQSDRKKSRRKDIGFELSNFAALFLLAVLVSGPIWGAFVPWPERLFEDLAGSARVGIGLILLSSGLLMWPCGIFLARSFLRQTRWSARFVVGGLAGLCLFRAWAGTGKILAVWGRFFAWMGA